MKKIIKVTGKKRPLTLMEFLSLMELRFKLFGRSDTQKKFDKYKHKYYNEGTDGWLETADLSFIENDFSDEE